MDEKTKTLIISAFSFMDSIRQRSDLMVYDFDVGQATCRVCWGKSAEGKRAAGLAKIEHKPNCEFDRVQKSLEPFKAIWMEYLKEKYPGPEIGSDLFK